MENSFMGYEIYMYGRGEKATFHRSKNQIAYYFNGMDD